MFVTLLLGIEWFENAKDKLTGHTIVFIALPPKPQGDLVENKSKYKTRYNI